MIFWLCREFRLLIAPLPSQVLTGLINRCVTADECRSYGIIGGIAGQVII